ncbi:zinc finger CCHC domain-containing protein 18-like [Saccostrea cucullata]|uniref:zinc finger CCHC domain-containing protein 18-like n=1 Tax=Saccostrea cuccullata TaxID=36930 RepID=UPI002ED07DB5
MADKVEESKKADKVSEKLKKLLDKAKEEGGSLHEESKLDFAGVSEADVPKTSTPVVSKDQKPLMFPNAKTSEPYQFPPPPSVPADIGKGDPYGEVKFKSFSGLPPQSNPFKLSQEGNTSHFYEVTHSQIPRIPQFSGDEPPQKGDVTYREWRYEVQCLMNDPEIKETVIIQSIRRSLRGTAKTMLIPLGEKASVQEILDKLNILFGEVSNNAMIMQEFFNAYQFQGECATSFGCRLESMLQNAIDNGYLNESSKNDLLRHKFWTSLSSDRLKSQTRHKYDTLKNYDQLLLEIRRVEKEIMINKKSSEKVSQGVDKNPRLHQHGISVESEAEERINKKIQNLQTELEGKIEDKFSQILMKLDAPKVDSRQDYSRGRGSFRGRQSTNRGRGEYFKGNSHSSDSSRGSRGNLQRGQYRGYGKPKGQYHSSGAEKQDPNF